MSFVFRTVKKIAKKFKTTNPKEICNLLDIDILYLELGNIGGFKTTKNRISTIYINSSLPENLQLFILAHELGHILLHKGISTPFFKFIEGNTFLPKIESEANLFAMKLLLDMYEEDKHLPLDYLIERIGLPKEQKYLFYSNLNKF